MRPILFLICFLAALLLGLWMGQERLPIQTAQPMGEKKSFVLLVYSCNAAPWCERALQSIFEQDYEAYRVIVVDDASCDGSAELMQRYVLENNQEERFKIIRNESRLGPIESLKRGFSAIEEAEFGVFLNGIDWLSSTDVLSRLNNYFQNPAIWLVTSHALAYPSYQVESEGLWAVYGSIAKNSPFSGIEALKREAKGHTATLRDPLQFKNEIVQMSY